MKMALVDSYDFEKIVSNDNIYVDKTAILYDLITSDSASRFFIARPRRFGKSLMISTLDAIFSGRKDLFKDCAIYEKPYDWKKYPIVHLDMSSVLGGNVDELRGNIVNMIRRMAERDGIESALPKDGTHSACFASYIDALSRKCGNRIVVLVDEYDAPVNGLVETGSDSDAVRKVLHDFYTQLKSFDAHIRFIMMTGVSKFAKLSVFSGLNNLKDLTLEASCAGLLGYTEPEIKTYFGEHIDNMADKWHTTADDVLKRLLSWYDGYRFSPYSEIKVTNPVSLASALDSARLDGFWDETGHSSLIFRYLKNRRVAPSQLNGCIADKSDLSFCDIQNASSPALLFQTGYLTIDKGVDDRQLQFKIPNKEVEQALNADMLSYLLKDRKTEVRGYLDVAKRDLKINPDDCSAVLNRTLIPAFQAIPYDWKVNDEPEARRMFLFYCSLMGASIIGEVHSNKGRADAVLTETDAVFIFEFKYNHSSAQALRQAEEKNYAGPFKALKKPIYLIGVNCNLNNRAIDAPMIKKLDPLPDGQWSEKLITVAVGGDAEDEESDSDSVRSASDEGARGEESSEMTGSVYGGE